MKIKDFNLKRILIYLAGMVILAMGLTLNTKVTLGVSPILSVPYALAEILDSNFADLVFVWYILFIIIQLIIHLFITKAKDQLISDVLQIVISLIFTRIMNIISLNIPVFETECTGFFSTLVFRMMMLLCAIVLTGIGACLTLNMQMIPNPGEGIVAAISTLIRKPVGTTKNLVDITCVIITLIISLLCKGKIIGIGIGTLCATLGVGRVIAFTNRLIDFSKIQ